MNIIEEQRNLAMLCLYTGAIDGISGKKTETSRALFMQQWGVEQKDYYAVLRNKRKEFINLCCFDYKKPDAERLAQAVKSACIALGYDDGRLWAYIMATVQYETGGEYWPVTEGDFIKDDARREQIRKSWPYYPYIGRGYVQLTHKINYDRYGTLLDYDFNANPERLLEPCVSLFVLLHGMLTGSFTGQRLTQYINAGCDYEGARWVVNGQDKAALIAGYAQAWEQYYATE